MENLKVGMNEIQKSIKPQLLNLFREVRDLNHALLDGEKRMEGIEDKIQLLQKNVALAKSAYQDKFQLNPDEITGSPVQKLDYEYTVEYEKLRDTIVGEPSIQQPMLEEPIEEELDDLNETE
jgi:hypothetical protein